MSPGWLAKCIINRFFIPENSACQEKYLRELSITPMRYFLGANSLDPVGLGSQGLFFIGENEHNELFSQNYLYFRHVRWNLKAYGGYILQFGSE
jgi:hypothetical protein